MTRALSIRQPWAWLIVQGLKPVENRQRRSHHRGLLLIHAGRQLDDDFGPELHDWVNETLRTQGDGPLPPVADLLRGGIVGCVTMTDCVAAHPSPWFFGPYGYVLEDAERLPFHACPGRLGFFDVELPEVLPL